MNIQVKSMAIPLAFLALAAATSAWSADTIDETRVEASHVAPPSITVRYGDLNLSSEEGRESLNARLSRAAKTVCDHHGYTRNRSLSYLAKTKTCYEDAMAAALNQVESVQLAAID
jgi:UrcA family protein